LITRCLEQGGALDATRPAVAGVLQWLHVYAAPALAHSYFRVARQIPAHRREFDSAFSRSRPPPCRACPIAFWLRSAGWMPSEARSCAKLKGSRDELAAGRRSPTTCQPSGTQERRRPRNHVVVRRQRAQGHKSACVGMILFLEAIDQWDGNNRICRHEQNAINRLVEIGLGTA
jgi:hypothetical protein